MPLWKILPVALIAYLLGSIPTALIYSRIVKGQDIRTLGDGNMGARNTKRIFGWRAGVIVALADILKGWAAVWLSIALALPESLHYICAALAVLGHDFSIFARFKGGQGFAVTIGIFLGLFPLFTLIATALYGVIYFATRSSDLAAGIGMGLIAAAQWISGAPFYSVVFIVIVLLFIPLKKWIDKPRRLAIEQQHLHPS